MNRLWRWWRGRRFVVRGAQTISARELQGMFQEAPHSKLWQGVLVVLEEQVAARNDRALNARVSDAETKYVLGGVDALLELREELLAREEAAKREEEREGTA